MGACVFTDYSRGKTAYDAFNNAVEAAQYECGHGGYTGTIAEKSSFVELDVPEGKSPEDYADQLLADDDDRIENKWGPAGCVKVKDGQYLFFGWASE
jgi:hypothetical protein